MTARERSPERGYSFLLMGILPLMLLALWMYSPVAIAQSEDQPSLSSPGGEGKRQDRPSCYVRKSCWGETVLATRTGLLDAALSDSERREGATQCLRRLQRDFPLQTDWALQDAGHQFVRLLIDEDPAPIAALMLKQAAGHAPEKPDALNEQLDPYVAASERRRGDRLAPLIHRWPSIVFTKHYNLGGSHYAYTEGQSDAQAERHFVPGSTLCLLEIERDAAGKVKIAENTLLDDPGGVIRDPDVSYDGKRILFAWKKSDREDDYHLYEMNRASGAIRQLTRGLGFADYEGAYLPNGDIVFNSTRCVQTVDCWWTEVSNLYLCNSDGEHMRRISFDQVHTNYPAVLSDGRVAYTRWEYNDRGQIYPQALFQMRPDGTGQMALYGNNSWFPTSILHARGIPGSRKIMAIASGHHTKQMGQLIIIDPAKGREENAGVRLIAPVRETKALRIDRYGQENALFQYPYPLSENEFLVACQPRHWIADVENPTFNIYFMTSDGERELLATDASTSCNQPVPLVPRKRPHIPPSSVDYTESTGVYYVHDVYAGPGLAGVPRGTVKSLRVVALDFRAAGIGSNRNSGDAGGALISTPPGVNNAAWDPKIVLGEAKVYEDGSACFTVPARTPVYFQALDANRHAVQTMRSWSTLQPGERFSCVGCHEHPNEAPPATLKPTQAMAAGPRELEPFYGPPRGFSFPKEVQPILDKHCVRCHTGTLGNLTVSFSYPNSDNAAWSIKGWAEPRNSGDRHVPRATWWDHKGTREWVQCDFEKPVRVRALTVYWFDDSRSGGGCRVPAEWRLLHNAGGEWVEVEGATEYGVAMDAYNRTEFPPTWVSALRLEVQLQPGFSGGILRCRLETAGKEGTEVPFSLRGMAVVDSGAKRKWSESYISLTRGGMQSPLVNWVSPQSAPPMLPPYHAGAATSELLTMLREGHEDVRLSQEELDKIACWIDLLVPYCGDYLEANAWTEDELAKYRHFLEKRNTMALIEQDNIGKLLDGKSE